MNRDDIVCGHPLLGLLPPETVEITDPSTPLILLAFLAVRIRIGCVIGKVGFIPGTIYIR
jgi:hypothetical protein